MNLEKARKELKELADSIETIELKNLHVEIKPDLIDDFEAINSEIDLVSNLTCLKCKNLPAAPIRQCVACDHLYCENCETEKCLNKKCGRGEFKKVSRNIRNIIFSLDIGGINYEPFMKKNVDEFKATIKYECKHCLSKFDEKRAMMEHDCQKLTV